MRTTIKVLSFVFLFVLASFSNVTAQKYGHMNLGNLLAELPEVKVAEKELETFRIQLTSVGEQMVQDFQKGLEAAQAKVASNEWSPAQIQAEQTKMATQEQQIRVYEQEVIAKVGQKREALLSPILQKIETTLKAVAEEEGYVMIFDTSLFNAILFAKDSEDVTAKVKARM